MEWGISVLTTSSIFASSRRRSRSGSSQFGGKLYLEFGGKLFRRLSRLPGSAGLLAGQQGEDAAAAEGPGGDRHRHQRRGHREEQGPRGLGHHLRRGRAAADRRLPGHRPVCGQRGADPVRRPSPRRMPSRTAWRRLGVKVLPALSPSQATPPTFPSSSATRASAKTSTSRPPAPWWWSRPPAPAAAKWPPASPSSTTSTSGASRRATPSLRPSPSGTCP